MSDQPTVSINQIWDDFTGQLRRFVASRIRNETDADDILQNVFIKIHRNIDRLEDPSKLQSWVYQITRNAIIDYYRKGEPMISRTGL